MSEPEYHRVAPPEIHIENEKERLERKLAMLTEENARLWERVKELQRQLANKEDALEPNQE